MQKQCSKCKIIKDFTNFSPNKKTKSGLDSWCGECKKILYRQTRIKNGFKLKPIPLVFDDKKECLKCNTIYHIDNFPNSSRGRLKRSSYCKNCWRVYLTEERFRAKNRLSTQRWRAKHRIHQFNRKRLIKATDDGSVTELIVKALYDETVCYYCKENVAIENRTIDHKIPLSRQGKHTKENLVMCCVKCNCSKQDKTEEEFVSDRSENYNR